LGCDQAASIGLDRIANGCPAARAAAIAQATAAPRRPSPVPTQPRYSRATCANGLPTASAVTRRPRPLRPVPRLLLVQPGQAPRPVELDLLLCTERGTPVRPEHASRAFRAFAEDAEIQAHPHLLRHSLASAMAAAKEPASVIAGQLRHADGGTLASRTYIHQLPQTPLRLARLIEDLYGPEARQAPSADRKLIEGR
jgi:hypothetical protein